MENVIESDAKNAMMAGMDKMLSNAISEQTKQKVESLEALEEALTVIKGVRERMHRCRHPC